MNQKYLAICFRWSFAIIGTALLFWGALIDNWAAILGWIGCLVWEIGSKIADKIKPRRTVWTLFLDDEREPARTNKSEVIYVARSVTQAKLLIEILGCPTHVDFDHDLGEGGGSGMEFAKWLVEQDLDGKISIPRSFTFVVHSQNPIGGKNIYEYLYGYLRQKWGLKGEPDEGY